MKILITGDIHGRLDLLKEVIKRHSDIDYHLNTGDLGITHKDIEENKLIAVKGNMDIYSTLPEKRVITIEGIKILLTHGHLLNVKYSLEDIKKEAEKEKVDVCIFGHTHYLKIESIDDILYLNPGSLKEEPHNYMILEGKKVQIYKL